MKKLLFTGASGFLGINVMPILAKNYDITTIGLSTNDTYQVNMANTVPQLDNSFDIVLHAAGKAHVVPRTPAEEKAFYDVNFEGTKNLCLALEKCEKLPQTIIFISTVAVYGCDSGMDITEEHPLNGDTPYAKSKIMAEEFLSKWCTKNNVALGIIRPSLIAGPNAPGNLGDMVRGIKTGRYLSIKGKTVCRKSVLMVQDIATLVTLLETKKGINIYNVCDSHQPGFNELEALISSQLGKRLPLSIPLWMAKCMAYCGDIIGEKSPINTLKLKKITESLTFSNKKAIMELNWMPTDVLKNYKIK